MTDIYPISPENGWPIKWTKQPSAFRAGGTSDAIEMLRIYFSCDDKGFPNFSGSMHSHPRFTPDLKNSCTNPDSIDLDDIVSIGLLSTALTQRSILDILGTVDQKINKNISKKLENIPHSLESAESNPTDVANSIGLAYIAINRIYGLGYTRTTKVLARKRPEIAPIVDTFIVDELGLEKWKYKEFCIDLWKLLETPRTASAPTEPITYIDWIEGIRSSAADTFEEGSLSHRTLTSASAIRIFDVITWMSQWRTRTKKNEEYYRRIQKNLMQ